MTLWLDVPFLLLVVVLAFLAVRARRLFAAVTTLGAYGFVLALEWALLGAVDVSFTEAVIGAGAWTVFMLSAMRRVGESERTPDRRRRGLGGLLAVLALGSMLVIATTMMPAFGDARSAASTHVSPRYIERAVAETATPNTVSAVLADYRSIDTLFETVVVFSAAMGIVLLLGLGPRREAA